MNSYRDFVYGAEMFSKVFVELAFGLLNVLVFFYIFYSELGKLSPLRRFVLQTEISGKYILFFFIS